MRVFMDWEFSRLRQDAQPISMGLVAEDGQEFYAVFPNFRRIECSSWVKDHVLPHIYCQDLQVNGPYIIKPPWTVARVLLAWLEQWEEVELWGDVPAFDWVLFCELFNNPNNKSTFPKNLKPDYLCRDLATVLEMRGLDPDCDRGKLAGNGNGVKHSAIWDARVIRACYEKVMSEPKRAKEKV